MKTRDKIKFAFAGFLALMTVIAISGLLIAKHQRKKTTREEEMRIQQTLAIYGQNGALPAKVELPEETPRGAGEL